MNTASSARRGAFWIRCSSLFLSISTTVGWTWNFDPSFVRTSTNWNLVWGCPSVKLSPGYMESLTKDSRLNSSRLSSQVFLASYAFSWLLLWTLSLLWQSHESAHQIYWTASRLLLWHKNKMRLEKNLVTNPQKVQNWMVDLSENIHWGSQFFSTHSFETPNRVYLHIWAYLSVVQSFCGILLLKHVQTSCHLWWLRGHEESYGDDDDDDDEDGKEGWEILYLM